jgi:lysophospholipase L1-like esterase
MVRRGATTPGPAALLVLGLVVAVCVAYLAPGAGAASRANQPTYVALGDSFSSGEGLAPYLAGSQRCDRSPEAYPELVARRLGAVRLRFLACSGASIAQVDRQIRAVPASGWRRVRLTTVTAGGNDLPFSGLIAACVGAVTSAASPTIRYLPGESGSAPCATAISGAASLLGAGVNPVTGDVTVPVAALKVPATHESPLEARLTRLLRDVLHAEGAVRDRAGGPRLLVVQYPTLLGSPGLGACLLSPTPLPEPGATTTSASGQALYPAFANATSYALGALNAYLQLETSVVVETLRADGYRGVTTATAGRGFTPLDCTTGSSPDLNGLLVSGSSPTVGSGSFHPTAAGQSALAASVAAAWRAATRGR